MERSDYCHERQLYCIPKNFRIISFWPYFSYLYDYYALIMTLDHQLTSLLDHPLTHQLSKSWPTRFQTNRPTKNQINDHDQNQDQQNRKMQDWSRSRANQSPPNVFRNPRRLNPKFLSPNTSIIAKTKKQPQSTHHKKARVTLQQYRIHQIGLPPNTLYPLLNTVYYHNCSQLSFLRRAGIRKNLFHPAYLFTIAAPRLPTGGSQLDVQHVVQRQFQHFGRWNGSGEDDPNHFAFFLYFPYSPGDFLSLLKVTWCCCWENGT